MDKVKKYSLDESTGRMVECPCGGWFTAEDYYALQDNIVAKDIYITELKDAIKHLRICRLCAEGQECIDYNALLCDKTTVVNKDN